MHPFRFVSGLLLFKSTSCSVRDWLLPKTCPCKMNLREWTLWWVTGRRMWKGLLWRRWGETWWKLGMGDVERRKDDTFFLSPLSSNPLWFVDCSVLRDFHGLFFLVVTLSNCVTLTYILTCVLDCCVRPGRMNLAQVRGSIHTAATAELCRSHKVQGWGPGWCALYDAQRLNGSLPALRHSSHLCLIFHFISSSQHLLALSPFSPVFSISLSLHWLFH